MAMASMICVLPVSNSQLTFFAESPTPFLRSEVPITPQLWRGRISGRTRQSQFLAYSPRCKAETETRTPPTADASLLVKMAWYGSEAFGKVVAAFRPRSDDAEDEEGEVAFVGPVSRNEVVELIRKDYERSYFVTGNMNMGIYEADCEFADPFVSFKGLKRFKQNVSNLGPSWRNPA